MEGTSVKIQDVILNNTPFRNICNVYKEDDIPILKEYDVEQCKEHIKQILDRTKNPLSQHVDVLIPTLDRNNFEKIKLDYVKSFFGKKYTLSEQNQNQNTKKTSIKTAINDNVTQNACIFDTSISFHVKELIDTEEAYVTKLEEIVYKCMIPIKQSIENPQKAPILDQYSFNKIFINVDDILKANKSFLTSLLKYKEGSTPESIGEIFLKHVDSFDCYKIFYLGHQNALSSHKQNMKQNKNYLKFHANMNFEGSLSIGDLYGDISRRLSLYKLIINNIIDEIDPRDSDVEHFESVLDKLNYLNNRLYGDSSLLNLYHLIHDAPASLIQTRQLLGYFDATELSLSSGKSTRPVTILVFTDKLMVVKRKHQNIQGKDILENLEDKTIDKQVSNVFQKAKEVYNGSQLDFKGWVDIRAVEIFHGLKDRPETFFIKTSLPEQSPEATEKECEDYFRRNNRLYSIIPNNNAMGPLNSYLEKKKKLISLCQNQYAISKLKDPSDELYIEDRFKLPAYTHFYSEKSYQQAKYKNNVLIIYVEENCPVNKLDINSLVNDDVWVVIILTYYNTTGCKLTIRARTNLIPIRERSRELEYECLVSPVKRENDGRLDFIDTLWNNVFFYERRLRATFAYSQVSDNLLRGRGRSRSRSKSITRPTSSMSLGKIFSRSRSSSPTRASFETQRSSDTSSSTLSNVSDPVFKVASISKQVENEFRNQPQTLGNGMYSDEISPSSSATLDRHRLSRVDTESRYRQNCETSASKNQNSVAYLDQLISSANSFKQTDESYYNGIYDDRTYQSRSSDQSYINIGSPLFSQSPELISRPPSGGSNNSTASSETSPGDFNQFSSRPSMSGESSVGSSYLYNTTGSYASSHIPYGGEYADVFSSQYKFNSLNLGSGLGNSNGNNSSNTKASDEHLMSELDKSRKTINGSIRKAPLDPKFYNQPSQSTHHPLSTVHRAFSNPDIPSNQYAPNQIRNDIINLMEENLLLQGQWKAEDINSYCMNRLQAIVSKIDRSIEDPYQLYKNAK